MTDFDVTRSGEKYDRDAPLTPYAHFGYLGETGGPLVDTSLGRQFPGLPRDEHRRLTFAAEERLGDEIVYQASEKERFSAMERSTRVQLETSLEHAAALQARADRLQGALNSAQVHLAQVANAVAGLSGNIERAVVRSISAGSQP